MATKYTIGIDFGSLSARAVLVDTASGREIAGCEYAYPHAVMNEEDISGKRAQSTTALQHPADYLEALGVTVRGVITDSGVSPEEIAALALDFTASNILPILECGTPLAFLEEFKSEPHAYVKMWKHHGAASEAEELTRAANRIDPSILESYGGKISGEWAFSKIYETLHGAPLVYEKADLFMEAGDWLVLMLTGKLTRSACMVGYKALWDKERGYPCNEMFTSVDERLSGITDTKLRGEVVPLGSVAGGINEYGASLAGLPVGTPVAASVIDAHAALPAAGAVADGDLMIIMGTSACHILISKSNKPVRGICGRVNGGVIPGYIAYESGQPAVGDALAWFMKNCVPARCEREASELGIGIFDYMNTKAEALGIGGSGLLALDWWNGSRSPYADYELSGLILGLTLSTPPEAIYRAIVESIAFGTRRIIEDYDTAGVAVRRIVVGGGIAKKNAFIMQTVANVLGMEVSVSDATQAGALGCAIYAAACGGIYKSIGEAAQNMASGIVRTYRPQQGAKEAYDPIYREYFALSEYFYKKNPVMRRLRAFGEKEN